ncbi:hypothetical protein FKM82_004313 [Ascaphus truei]
MCRIKNAEHSVSAQTLCSMDLNLVAAGRDTWQRKRYIVYLINKSLLPFLSCSSGFHNSTYNSFPSEGQKQTNSEQHNDNIHTIPNL